MEEEIIESPSPLAIFVRLKEELSRNRGSLSQSTIEALAGLERGLATDFGKPPRRKVGFRL